MVGDAVFAESAERYLIVGPSWVGDMVLAHSLFQILKQNHPRAAIDVLAPDWTLPLLARMPEVDDGIGMPFGHGQLDIVGRWRLGKGMRDKQYAHAIVLPNSWKSAVVPFAARAVRRTGYVGELRYGLLNDMRRLDAARLARTVDRFVALGVAADAPLPTSPMPRLRANAENARVALARLDHHPPAKPVLGLCPGAEYGPAKRWPSEYFAEVANAMLAQDWEVWLFGSDKDQAITREVQHRTGGQCLDLGGRTPLADAIDLMSLTRAVISNDSGLMHVAAALGRQVIAVYGSSDPGHTPPMSERAAVLYLGLSCSPCFERECPLGHLNCLRQIRSAQVLALLQRGDPPESGMMRAS